MGVFDDDFDKADHTGEIRKRDTLTIRRPVPYVHILTRPVASLAKCEHDWPELDVMGIDVGTDINGSCTKCGMSFMLYIHSDCP